MPVNVPFSFPLPEDVSLAISFPERVPFSISLPEKVPFPLLPMTMSPMLSPLTTTTPLCFSPVMLLPLIRSAFMSCFAHSPVILIVSFILFWDSNIIWDTIFIC